MRDLSLLLLAILFACGYSLAQVEVPVPDYDLLWEFSLENFQESPNNTLSATFMGSRDSYIRAYTDGLTEANFVKDKDNNASKAIKMKEDSKIDFSSFLDQNDQKYFGLSPHLVSASEVDAITISMWVNFVNETDDYRMLIGAKKNEADSYFKFGLSLKGKTLYLCRYHENEDGSIGAPWVYELFAPAAFDAGFGWYFVSMTFARTQKYMRVFLGKPNGGAKYGPGTDPNVPGSNTVTREFDGRLIWIPGIRKGHQDFNHWSIENAHGLSFDKLKIWHQALTFEQVKQLYTDEKNPDESSSNTIIASASNKIVSGRDKEDIEEPVQNFESGIEVYPNPNSGNFTINLTLKEASKVVCSLYDLQGRQVYNDTGNNLNSGRQTLNMDVGKLAKGIYLLNIKSDTFLVKGYKLIID